MQTYRRVVLIVMLTNLDTVGKQVIKVNFSESLPVSIDCKGLDPEKIVRVVINCKVMR